MKVIIAYDGSACANAALDDLARAGLPSSGRAVVLSAGRTWPLFSEIPPPHSVMDQELAAARKTAAGAAERAHAQLPAWEVRSEGVLESPQWAIIQKADDWQADLIVLGSHGRSAVGRALFGSVSHSVLTHAKCSV